MSFEVKVFDIFHLQSNQTVFAGLVSGHDNLLTKCKAQLLIDNKTHKVLVVEGEFIMDRKHPLGHRAISTKDTVDLTSEFVKAHDCRLKQID